MKQKKVGNINSKERETEIAGDEIEINLKGKGLELNIL